MRMERDLLADCRQLLVDAEWDEELVGHAAGRRDVDAVELFRGELRLLPATTRGRDGTIAWRPSAPIALATGGLMLASLLLLNRMAPFLYFQF